MSDCSKTSGASAASVAKIALISVVGLIVGASVLSGFFVGPLAIVGGPIFAVFGWFYLVPIFICVSLLWFSYNPSWRPQAKTLFVIGGTSGACLLMLAIGIRGPESEWFWGYLSGGVVAGCVCSSMVVGMKSKGHRNDLRLGQDIADTSQNEKSEGRHDGGSKSSP
jgi:hypothetical protein